MRKFNPINKANSNNARGGKRGRLIGIGVFLLLALFFLGFFWYGLFTFLRNYTLRSPIIIRSPIVKRETTKIIAPRPHQPRSKGSQTKKGIIPQVEAAEPKIESFPKYLTDQGARTREIVLDYLDNFYSGDQLIAFDNLIKKESGYRYDAVNEIGACGFPQSLPCEKMNCPLTSEGIICQANWMKIYIENRYGTPLEAWNHSEQVNWY